MFEEGFPRPPNTSLVSLRVAQDFSCARNLLAKVFATPTCSWQDIRWTKIVEGWVKLNKDGSSRGNSGFVGKVG